MFELEWKGERFFQGDQKRGEMNYVSLCWRRELSNRFKFWLENGIGFFRNSSVYRKLLQAPQKTITMTQAKWTIETRWGVENKAAVDLKLYDNPDRILQLQGCIYSRITWPLN